MESQTVSQVQKRVPPRPLIGESDTIEACLGGGENEASVPRKPLKVCK